MRNRLIENLGHGKYKRTTGQVEFTITAIMLLMILLVIFFRVILSNDSSCQLTEVLFLNHKFVILASSRKQ